jgi:hypothetical protein
MIGGIGFVLVALLVGLALDYSSEVLLGMLTLTWTNADDTVGLHRAVAFGYALVLAAAILRLRSGPRTHA